MLPPLPFVPPLPLPPCWNDAINSATGGSVVAGVVGGAKLKPFMSRRSFWRFFLPPVSFALVRKNENAVHISSELHKNVYLFWYVCSVHLPAPCPEAVLVFMPLPFRISTNSQRNAEMSCLISLTSSSVTPCDSAFRCSTVTYRLTKFRMICYRTPDMVQGTTQFRYSHIQYVHKIYNNNNKSKTENKNLKPNHNCSPDI